MQYKKINVGPYNLHVINTDKFKTVSIKINFKRLLTKQDITYRHFLANILLESALEYQTKRDIAIACEELYDLHLSSNTILSGNYDIMSFSARYLNSKYAGEDMDEKVISFISNLIFKPNVLDKSFNETAFNIVRKQMMEDFDSYKENPKKYSLERMYEELDKKSPLSYRSLGYEQDLAIITTQNLYEYYNSVITSDLIDIFIIGEVDYNKIKRILLKYLDVKTIKKAGSSHFIEHTKYRKRSKTIKETSDFTQSQLVIGVKAINLTPFERKYVAAIYSYILGGSPDSKLFKNVREKHSLCYFVSSQFQIINNLLVIRSGINKENFKEAVKLIKKEFKNMEKGLFDEEDIKAAQTTYLNSCKQILDSPSDIVKTYVASEYLGSDTIEDKMTNIVKVDKNDIINLARKFHFDTIFLLEGDGIYEA
ncbi:MAG: pitrilysin family protein [Bacilli bacterium]|nr:pitrilysin family protein [Bacilli bacterium]